MRILLAAGAVTVLALSLGSCATMNEEQCLAGDWVGQGYSDAAAGRSPSRLSDHAEACAKHGITPDAAAYRSGWDQGIPVYCTPANGFRSGRNGNGYSGVCPAELEGRFYPAWQDGRVVWEATRAEADARSLVNTYASQLENYDDRLEAQERELRAEGLTQEQRDAIRARIRDIRRERDNVERDWRRAQNALDDAEQRVREVRYRFEPTYGSWF